MTISAPPLPNSPRQRLSPSTDSQNAAPLRITVVYQTRNVTLQITNEPIVADILPDIARRLGVLDPAVVFGGFRLIDRDGEALSPPRPSRNSIWPIKAC